MASSKKKTWFVLASILLHTGLGVGIFASGVWNIERLDGTRMSSSFAVILPPMPAPAGGDIKLAEVKLDRKKKPPPPVIVQLETKQDASTKPSEVPTTVIGEGSGSGSGSGSSTDIGECLVDCGPGTGSGSTSPVVTPPPKADEDTFVPPNVLTMMRLSGSTQIHPSDVTKISMQRDGRTRTVGVAKVCVSESGAVTHVSMLSSTKYPAYDAQLTAGIKTWTYKPYAAKGRNVKVCGTVTFVYGMK
ncbi:MAG: energy transducer TonB [Deltaproteobacteria bacterium]|nr:energy transducer TonB [Deltaproteobacteria bacterium]